LSKRQDSWWNHRPSMYLPRKIEEPWARCTREQLPPNHVVLVLAKVTMVRSIEYSFPDQPNNLRWNLKLVMGLQFLPRHFYKHVTCSSLAPTLRKHVYWSVIFGCSNGGSRSHPTKPIANSICERMCGI
jgi:hypothetical protein